MWVERGLVYLSVGSAGFSVGVVKTFRLLSRGFDRVGFLKLL